MMITEVDKVDFKCCSVALLAHSMNVTAPPKPAVILAAPINVEESRAQRLQRQQARFRDRGGHVVLVLTALTEGLNNLYFIEYLFRQVEVLYSTYFSEEPHH